jgi:putative membrane protein
MGKGKTLGFALSTAMMCLALLCVTAAAQNTNSGGTNSGGTNSGGANSNTTSTRNGGGTATMSSSDRKFAMTAAMGGMAEVEMSRLALTKGSSDAVKQYAQKMIDDHTAANAELMQLATSKGITLPAAPDPKMRAMMTRMDRLSGADFDREYIMMAGNKDHQKMEKLFRDESARGRDADLKAFAAKTLPVVQQHLQMARDLHGGMSGMTGANRSK